MIFRSHAVLASGCLLSLANCASVPPPPAPPEPISLSATFANMTANASETEQDLAEWWTGFDDPLLTGFVEQALEHNKDLDLARANIETARSVFNRQSLGQSYSTLSTAAAELGRAAREDADTELTGNAQLGASWELDLFDRIASEIESAALDVQRFEQIQRDVAVAIAADTALAYVDMRGNQVRLSVAQSNADLQKESLDLLKILFENGRATRLDMERAESQYRTTLASLPLLEANIRTASARLTILLGQSDFSGSAVLSADTTGAVQIPDAPEVLGVGDPDALIRRRPDIRAAETEIARRMALGEVERARLFPTLTFNANLLALLSEDSTADNSFGFGIGPALRWDGPDLRRVRADIDIADAQTRAAIASYEATVINALGEVEIALVSFAQERARRDDLEVAAASAERAVDLARLRFDEGLDDFLDVIDAQRTLLDAQDRLENSRLTTTRQAISTYRALGGIWQTDRFSAGGEIGE